jgi:hypothetical protein
LLGVPPDADDDLLRLRIRESYIEATANSDHRNMERRIHYQSMVERILPQCRRILLNPEGRAAYDHQTALHHQGLPGAMDYASFVNTATSGVAAPEDNEANILPGKVIEPTRSEARRADEMAQARAILESLDSADGEPDSATAPQSTHSSELSHSSKGSEPSRNGSGRSATPHAAQETTGSLPTEVLPSPASISGASSTQETPTSYSAAPVGALREIVAQDTSQPAAPRTARQMQQAAAQVEAQAQAQAQMQAQTHPVAAHATTQLVEATPQHLASVQSSNNGVVTVAPVAESVPVTATNPTAPASTVELDHDSAPRAQVLYAPRVSVGDVPVNRDARRGAKKGQRVLSSTSVNALIGIVAAGLMFAILHFTDPSAGPAAAPVRITYASELQPSWSAPKKPSRAANRAKASTFSSAHRLACAMQDALGQRGTPPDVWIPSESLWSDRYNEVAQTNKRQVIKVARSMALSPMVLIARSEHAAICAGVSQSSHSQLGSACALQLQPEQRGHFG